MPDEFNIPVQLHTLEKASRVVTAHIRRVSPSLFALTAEEPLPSGTRLALAHEGHRLEGEVLSVTRHSAELYALAVKVLAADFGEVRSEIRLPTDIPAVLRVAGRDLEISARVVDMSPSGMGLEVAVELAAGAKVCVSLEQGIAFGEIRSCRQKASGLYTVGFKLEEYLAPAE